MTLSRPPICTCRRLDKTRDLLGAGWHRTLPPPHLVLHSVPCLCGERRQHSLSWEWAWGPLPGPAGPGARERMASGLGVDRRGKEGTEYFCILTLKSED